MVRHFIRQVGLPLLFLEGGSQSHHGNLQIHIVLCVCGAMNRRFCWVVVEMPLLLVHMVRPRGRRETVADSEQRLINGHILKIIAPEANLHLSSLE